MKTVGAREPASRPGFLSKLHAKAKEAERQSLSQRAKQVESSRSLS